MFAKVVCMTVPMFRLHASFTCFARFTMDATNAFNAFMHSVEPSFEYFLTQSLDVVASSSSGSMNHRRLTRIRRITTQKLLVARLSSMHRLQCKSTR